MDIHRLPVSGSTMLRIVASLITFAVSSIWFEYPSTLVLGFGTYPLTFLLYNDRPSRERPLDLLHERSHTATSEGPRAASPW